VKQRRTYSHGGEPWLGFEAVRGLDGLGDDVLMIPLFGHTHGHCGIAVNTDDGWLLDAGDAYFDAREIKLPERKCGPIPALFQMMVTTERDKRREDQDRLRALHADHPEVEIFCGHNPFEYLDLVEKSGGTPAGDLANPPPGERGAAVTPMDHKNTTALITGASSGLGGPAAAV